MKVSLPRHGGGFVTVFTENIGAVSDGGKADDVFPDTCLVYFSGGIEVIALSREEVLDRIWEPNA